MKIKLINVIFIFCGSNKCSTKIANVNNHLIKEKKMIKLVIIANIIDFISRN